MYYKPNLSEIPRTYPNNISYARVANLLPGSSPMDIFIDGRLVKPRLSYKDYTQYIYIPVGYRTITVYSEGCHYPVVNSIIAAMYQRVYTLAIIGMLPNALLLTINDNVPSASEGAIVKFAHLSPDTPRIDVCEGEKILFSEIEYKNVTDYILIPPGKYYFKLKLSDTNSVALEVPDVSFKANKGYTLTTVGMLKSKPTLEMLTPVDSSSYI